MLGIKIAALLDLPQSRSYQITLWQQITGSLSEAGSLSESGTHCVLPYWFCFYFPGRQGAVISSVYSLTSVFCLDVVPRTPDSFYSFQPDLVCIEIIHLCRCLQSVFLVRTLLRSWPLILAFCLMSPHGGPTNAMPMRISPFLFPIAQLPGSYPFTVCSKETILTITSDFLRLHFLHKNPRSYSFYLYIMNRLFDIQYFWISNSFVNHYNRIHIFPFYVNYFYFSISCIYWKFDYTKLKIIIFSKSLMIF